MQPLSAAPAALGRLTGGSGGAGGRSAYLSASSPVLVPQKPGHGMLDFIPALTSALGAIGGGALGTAVAPGVGTAVGGIGGAGAGQAAGKAIENMLTGDQTTAGDELKQAALGSGGQLVGGIAGKAVGGLLGKVAGGLGGAGDNLVAKATFGGATKAAQIANKAGDTVSQLSNLGVSPKAVEAAIPQVTGDTGVLSNAVRSALKGAGPVDLTQAFPLAGRAADQLDVVKPGAGNAFRTVINNLTDNMIANGQPLTKVDANTAFDIQKQLESNAFSKGVDSAVRNAYLDVANHIGDKLTASGADNAVLSGQALTPKDVANLATISPQLAQAAQGAKTVGDLRSLQAPFVRAGKLLQDSATQGEQVSGTGAGPTALDAGAALLTHGASIPISAAKMALKSGAGQKIVGSVLQGVGGAGNAVGGLIGKLSNGVADATGAGSIGANVGRIVGNIAGQDNSDPNAPSAAAAVTPGLNSDGGLDLSGGPATTQPDSNNVFTPEVLQAMAISDIAKTGGKNLAQIATLDKLFGPSSASGTLSTQQKNEATASQKALSTLSDFSKQLKSVGGGQGPLGGTLLKFLGGSGLPGTAGAGNASALESQRVDVAQTIAGSLSPTGRPAASVTKLILDGLPSITDPSSVAQSKITQLAQRIKDGYYTALMPLNSGPAGTSTAIDTTTP